MQDDVFERVGRLWERPGWSQRRVARELGVVHGLVSQWNSGKLRPSRRSAARYVALVERVDAKGRGDDAEAQR